MSNPEKRSRSKANRQAARIAAAKKRARLRAAKVAGALAVVAAVVGVVILSADDGAWATEPDAWVLPAMGPTADIQDQVALSDFEGKPTIVNFFASWCEACDAELPGFRNVSQEFADEIQFVGIASQETGDELFMPTKHQVHEAWTLARDVGSGAGSDLSRAMGARGMPLTAFYAADGELLHIQLGAILEPELREAVRNFYGIESAA